MISLVALDGDKKESAALKNAVSDVAADMTEEYWDTFFFSTLEEYGKYLKTEPLIDFACYDVAMKGALTFLQGVRKAYEQTGLLLIADESISPLEYMKPGIRADSLLMRPFTEETMKATLSEFVSEGLERNKRKAGEESFVMETKEGKTYLPYDNIYYFESREKKVFVRLLKEEYGFYTTMDELEQQLRGDFIRCHRSYIINSGKIQKVLSGQNMIELKHGFTIPVSRSYKAGLKDLGRR
ncbi:MAG: LytTR family transcriptional regulator DNA-binding domain-containing protein [Lachnospiraceae bacterium]|nr:LytTR family transcriptional regulator DNA-binding domain-containing protein [Lachnospiraceae bacterium]